MAVVTFRLPKFDFKDQITVIVGPDDSEKHFSVHKDVICANSRFFRTAVGGELQEAVLKLVHLPAVDPDLFSIYVQWAYSGQIVAHSAAEQAADEHGTAVRAKYTELYLLGHVVGDTRLRNAATDCMVGSMLEHEDGFTPATIQRVWESSPPASKIRELMLDSVVTFLDYEWVEACRGHLPADFMAELAISFARSIQGVGFDLFRDFVREARCKYHDHDEDVPPCL